MEKAGELSLLGGQDHLLVQGMTHGRFNSMEAEDTDKLRQVHDRPSDDEQREQCRDLEAA